MSSALSTHIIDVSGHQILVKKSRRRKTMALKVNNDGIFLYIPDVLPMTIARAFVEKKILWIESKLRFTQNQSHSNQYAEGDTLLYFSEQYPIVLQENKSQKKAEISLEKDHVVLSGPISTLTFDARQKLFRQWFQQQANDYLLPRSEELSTRFGLQATSFTVKTYKARWGSCSIDGHIRYNWKIIQAPKDVIDYLIVHELCHLREHNHSASFWKLVALFCPEYKQHRHWLKTYGHLINI